MAGSVSATVPTEPSEFGPATQRVLSQLRRIWPVSRWSPVTVILGVSGGGDSVALACALHLSRLTADARTDSHPSLPSSPSEIQGRLVLAFFDHGLRSVEQERHCVERLAASLSLEFVAGQAPKPNDPSLVSEGFLREQRHAFFQQVLGKYGGRYLALAHTRDDQAETVLQRWFRGTGLRGLAGMRPFRPVGTDWVLARPLLNVRRHELRAMLKELKQDYCDDPTNEQVYWTRNWIRHTLIPQLETRFPATKDSIIRLSEQASEMDQALAVWAEQLLKVVCTDRTEGFFLRSEPLLGLPEIVVAEVIRFAWRAKGWPESQMSHPHWRTLSHWLGRHETLSINAPSKMDFPGGVSVARTEEGLEFSLL